MYRAELHLNTDDKVTITYMNKIKTYRVPVTGVYAVLGGEIELNGEHLVLNDTVDSKEPGLYPVSGAV